MKELNALGSGFSVGPFRAEERNSLMKEFNAKTLEVKDILVHRCVGEACEGEAKTL